MESTVRPAASARSAGKQARFTGLGVAAGLSAVFLAATLFQTLATFFIRLYESDVMLGAVGNVSLWSRVSLDIALFALGVLVLHALLALTVYGLARLSGLALSSAGVTTRAWVVLWFALALAAILLLNADWYPRSHSGSYYAAVASRRLGSWSVAEAFSGAAGVLALAVLMAALWRMRRSGAAALRGRLAAMAMVSAGVAAVFVVVARGTAPAEAVSGRPNVVILGIDSLRLGELQRFGGRGQMPNVDAFLEEADVFRDTVTPLGRTFPAWVSILTGRSPRSTGAIFNLVRRGDVHATPTIADLLADRGYETAFATDEIRFSNIDGSYGFHRVITPPIGAADFLIAQVGDLPLANVVSGTRLGGVLLGFLHANRGVAYLYDPASFLGRLRSELPTGRPMLLAIHLTAAHWPYFHATTPMNLKKYVTPTSNPVYDEAVQTADRMFGDVVALLREQGVLDNALVVLLSDHGEALRMQGDSLLDGTGDRVEGIEEPVQVLAFGHGQSVLSPVQYQVLLGFRGFGAQSGIGAGGRELAQPATLEDVVPTLMDLLREPTPAVDGLSLAPALLSPRVSDPLRGDRIRFTETDIRIAPSKDGELEEDDAARQAAALFEVDRSSGWLHLRPTMIDPLLAMKERAALDRDRLLAALPVDLDTHLYVLVDRGSGRGRLLPGRPDERDPGAARLWDALHHHFRGELRPPLVPKPEATGRLARQPPPSAGADPRPGG